MILSYIQSLTNIPQLKWSMYLSSDNGHYNHSYSRAHNVENRSRVKIKGYANVRSEHLTKYGERHA